MCSFSRGCKVEITETAHKLATKAREEALVTAWSNERKRRVGFRLRIWGIAHLNLGTDGIRRGAEMVCCQEKLAMLCSRIHARVSGSFPRGVLLTAMHILGAVEDKKERPQIPSTLALAANHAMKKYCVRPAS